MLRTTRNWPSAATAILSCGTVGFLAGDWRSSSFPVDTILTSFESLGQRGLFVARVNFHQKIIIESNVPLGQQENKGTSSVPEECQEIIERAPMLPSILISLRSIHSRNGIARSLRSSKGEGCIYMVPSRAAGTGNRTGRPIVYLNYSTNG